jgi:hypothetical protein
MRLIASPRDDFEVSPKRKNCIVNGILTPFDNTLVTMQRKIQSLYNIEKSIAIKNKKIDFFNQIWNAFTLLFN